MSIGEALNSYYGVLGSKKKVLGPRELWRWNNMFLVLCVIALSLDPLFCYILVSDEENKCLRLDRKLGVIAVILRFIIDFFYVFHIIFQFRASVASLSSRASGKGELVREIRSLAWKYFLSYFPVGALRISPLLCKVRSISGILAETAWANLFLYMLASHVVGAFWYLFSIERKAACWQESCVNHAGAYPCSLYCVATFGASTVLNDSCSAKTPNVRLFYFGIYFDAHESGVIDSADFVQRISYCFWWGLQNLSSLGQSLKTSTYLCLGNLLCCFHFGFWFGTIFISYWKYADIFTVKNCKICRNESEGTREREHWMAFYALPQHLKKRIKEYQKDQWQENIGINMDNFLLSLPRDIRTDTKRYLCFGAIRGVPFFETLDKQVLDAMCDSLKPVLYKEESYIVREGEPMDAMLFIMRGRLLSVTTNGARTGFFFNSVNLKAGDFCGEELLTWSLDLLPYSTLPISTRTVQALSEVEAFALKADDLKSVASQFRRLQTFRFYSNPWRTWAACYIQAAWRRHCKKKLEKSLRKEENRLQDALVKAGGSSPTLGSTTPPYTPCVLLLMHFVLLGTTIGHCYCRSQQSLIYLLKSKHVVVFRV